MKKFLSISLVLILILAVFAYGKKEEKKVQNAVAISGAIVIKDDGKHITYLDKCDACNKTGSRHNTTIYPGGKHRTSFKCSKCKNKNVVEIIRSK